MKYLIPSAVLLCSLAGACHKKSSDEDSPNQSPTEDVKQNPPAPQPTPKSGSEIPPVIAGQKDQNHPENPPNATHLKDPAFTPSFIFYVSTSGKSDGSGTQDNPFDSIETA